MSERVEVCVTLELLSDTIFGSGYSIPGGEDIAVVRDDKGYPYIPGTTVKGLLRESMENWIAWTDGDPSDIGEILGEPGWSGGADGRRLALTPLCLKDAPLDAEDCFGCRVFTALKDGVVKTNTLRTAACINKGLRFEGTMICAEDDVPLLKNALAGIKWAGAQRNRGFGQVRFQAKAVKKERKTVNLTGSGCIHYRLRAETPVIIMDLGRSTGNSYETQGYIPGSAVRGVVMSRLSAREPEWFASNKVALLSDRTRFLDALPTKGTLDVLPSIKGFYENKEETDFESVLKDGKFTAGYKRAKLGAFCGLDGDTVHYWSADTGGTTRIRRNVNSGEDTLLFQTRYLNAGQEFEGYIFPDDIESAPKIAEALSDTVWIGADRFGGYGKCTVTCLEQVDAPGWIGAYGYQSQDEVGTELYLLALSPLVMLDDIGDPVGLDCSKLAERLDVGNVEIQYCSTSMSKYDAYNRTWQCREPALSMYDRGSIFKLKCDRPPRLDAVRAVERTGLGVRAAQGFGQVLFLRKALFEGLCQKHAIKAEASKTATSAAQIRRAKYSWIMERSDQLRQDGLSESQLGSIQALCEKAIAEDGDTTELEHFLRKNETERGPEHGIRFRKIAGLIRNVIDQPLAETIGTDCTDSAAERLKLLCQLFNYSRKGKEAD